MRHLLRTLLLLTIMISIGCKNIDNNSDDFINIDLIQKYEDKSLKFNEFTKEMKLIKLETTENTMLRSFRGYIGDKYIISIDNEKVILFSSEGKFKCIISHKGRGPEEFQRIDGWDVDKDERFFIFHDYKRNSIKKYNLDSYKFEKDIPFIEKGSLNNILFINDTLISVMPNMFSNYGYVYFYQSTDGRIIEGKTTKPLPHPGTWAGRTPVFKKAADNSIYLQPSESDTIFKISNGKFNPIISIQVEKAKTDGEISTGPSVSFLHLDNKRVFLHKMVFEIHKTAMSVSMQSLSDEYLFLDRNDRKIYRMDSPYYDFAGVKIDMPNMIFLNYNQFYTFFQASRFKNLLIDAIKNGEIQGAKIDSVKQLYNSISDYDNPILISGKFK